MILSVSRRTDIPAFYSEWFINRIREGFLYVRNPMNQHQISRIALSPETVECIVFWTKNPAGLMEMLKDLKDYTYYFQFTLTGYGKDIEPNLPDKEKELIPLFIRLSEKIGKEKVIWRYDPILFSKKYTMEYHINAFGEIAEKLSDYTEKAVISFIDFYKKTKRNTAGLAIEEITDENKMKLAQEIVRIASGYHLPVETCAEQIDLSSVGVSHGSCIDQKLIEKLAGYRLTGRKDKNQRKECGCLESIEVGTYHTCLNGCKYCYANFSEERVKENVKLYHPDSPILCGSIHLEDKITERKVKILREPQLNLFDL